MPRMTKVLVTSTDRIRAASMIHGGLHWMGMDPDGPVYRFWLQQELWMWSNELSFELYYNDSDSFDPIAALRAMFFRCGFTFEAVSTKEV